MIKDLIRKHMANKEIKNTERQKINKLAIELTNEMSFQKMVHLRESDKLLVRGYSINPKYLDPKDYIDIIALYVFLKKYSDFGSPIDQELFEKIIMKGDNFAFLRKLNQSVKNLVEETLDRGPSYAGVQYAGQMKLNEDFKDRKI